MKRKVVQEQDEGSGGDDSSDEGSGRSASSDSGGDSGDGGESDRSSGSDDENDDSVTVGIDSAVLDCPVCSKPFVAFDLPLFQCTIGHMICSQCFFKASRKCPTCTRPTSRKRCLPFESIIKSNKISCPYSRFGCKVPITYAQIRTHKESCPYAPCFCPFPACRFRGTKNGLTSHIMSKHPSSEQEEFNYSVKVSLKREQPFFLLPTVCDLSVLLLNSHGMHSGNELSVVCIRPGPAFRSPRFQYELEVTGDTGKKLRLDASPEVTGDTGKKLRLDASPENVRKWTKDYSSTVFLCVPDDFIGSSGVINVTVCIRKLR